MVPVGHDESSTTCPCGKDATRRCDGCALAYCEACCDKRHRKGAFQRHTIVRLVEETTNKHEQTMPNMVTEGTRVCEECLARSALLVCRACELEFCQECAHEVHQRGAMQSHVANGEFVFLNKSDAQQEDPSESLHLADVGRLLEDDDGEQICHTRDRVHSVEFLGGGHSLARINLATGVNDVEEGIDLEDPDQEKSPTPVLKAASTTSDNYDLWGSWNLRSFSERASSIESSSQWRGLRSLSIDETPSSPPLAKRDELPLSSITKSLRSLSFASTDENPQPAPAKPKRTNAPRPRSFSDYTSLGTSKMDDIWNERVEPSHISSKSSSAVELWRSMRTNFASRHVVVKSPIRVLSDIDAHQIIETLKNFGTIASLRDELISDGLLFCTFYELKAAIGAVKLWSTAANGPSSMPPSESIHFSLPYEVPNEVNCATLMIRINGPPMSSGEMRQLCSHYGEIASVLQNDLHSGKYIVEYNDTRDVDEAMSGLVSLFHPSGQISVTRSHPPTLDMAKIQQFQDCVEARLSLIPVLEVGNRPKSYSASTTILTSPTSSTSSPLGSSFLDQSIGHPLNQEADIETARGTSSFPSTSPFGVTTTTTTTSSGATSASPWTNRQPARPRSSSAFASSSASMIDMFGARARSPPATTGYGYNGSNVHSGYHQSRAYNVQSPPLYQQQRVSTSSMGMSNRLNVGRSDSDPNFRHSFGYSGGSVGRNDRGTGEYTLALDKVISGEDTRTTLMIRNIPNKYTQQMLLSEINIQHHGKYDFFYLPIDFKNKCNMGYAFINFIEADSIVAFYQEFDSQKWTNFNSEKVCAISYARLQGKQAMITRFQNSSLLDKDESYRPLVFCSTGPTRGQPEPFPAPKPHMMAKKPNHQSFGANDEYGLSHASRMYLHHQAHLLHGQALLANAQAAAASMLQGVSGFGFQAGASHPGHHRSASQPSSPIFSPFEDEQHAFGLNQGTHSRSFHGTFNNGYGSGYTS